MKRKWKSKVKKNEKLIRCLQVLFEKNANDLLEFNPISLLKKMKFKDS